MNAGRDVERLIAGWLVDEALVRAPDRVLESARLSIDRTRQRRLAAVWREPMYLSPLRLTAIAAAFVVVLIGGAYLGRSTPSPDVGGQPTAAPTAAPTAVEVTLDSYRTARDEICHRYSATVDPLKPELEGIHDPATSATDRAAKAETLLDIVTQLEAMVAELDALEAPAQIAAAHAAYVTRYQDMTLFIRDMLTRVNEGDLVGAAAVDDAINVLNGPMLAFENDNLLAVCP